MFRVKSTIFYPFTLQIHVKTSFYLNERRMVKDSKTGDFGNYDFSRKNQNFEWKTTLKQDRAFLGIET